MKIIASLSLAICLGGCMLAPPMPEHIDPSNAQLVWLTAQPSPLHQPIWAIQGQYERLVTIQQAEVLYPDAESNYHYLKGLLPLYQAKQDAEILKYKVATRETNRSLSELQKDLEIAEKEYKKLAAILGVDTTEPEKAQVGELEPYTSRYAAVPASK